MNNLGNAGWVRTTSRAYRLRVWVSRSEDRLNVRVTHEPNLTDWLVGRSADQLADVLANRPDVCWGAPVRGLDDLAARLTRPASVAEAMTRLPLPAIELLQTLTALGPRPTVGDAATLLDRGGRSPQAQRKAVRSAASILEASALAWLTGRDGVAVNPGVRAVIDQPLGIGRTVADHLEHTTLEQMRQLLRTLGLPDRTRRADAAEKLTEFLTDQAQVRQLLAGAPEPARERLRALATAGADDSAFYRRNQQDQEGENWARRRGLLFGGQYYFTELPVEVALAVRSGELTVSFHPDAPALLTAPIVTSGPSGPSGASAAQALAAGAAAAAAEFTETVAALLDSMSRSPLPELKAGGVGFREVARLAKSIRIDESEVRLALELIRSLGLLTGVGAGVGVNSAATVWRAEEPSVRLADLAVAWWGLPVTPTVTHDIDGKAMPTIGARMADGSAMLLRWAVIDTVAALPPGTGLAEVDSLAEYLNWSQPGTIEPQDTSVAAVWTEAHTLGVLVGGALTGIGSALLQGDPAALLGVAESLLAPATSTGRFGSDLTVMVAGSPSAAVSALLDSSADRESRGAAVVWRFSPASVRRALDGGAAADELVRELRSIAETDLPQPLTYLISDVHRRHGSLIVRPALCCVVSADEALLVEVAAHRGLRALRPAALAPTVLSFQAEPSTVLATLRAAGYLPVPADEWGVVRLGGSTVEPTPDDGPAPAQRMIDQLPALHSHSSAQHGAGLRGDLADGLKELAEAILATASSPGNSAVGTGREPSETEAVIDAFGLNLDPVEQRQLAFAIDNQLPVQITYQSTTGGVTTRTISDIELVAGLMYAWCHLRDDERVFAVDRVQAVQPVDG